MNLSEVKEKVESGIGTKGVFGGLAGSQDEMLEAARTDFRSLVKACHPDLVPAGEKDLAAATFNRLRELYLAVTEQIRSGNYGKASVSTGDPAVAAIIETPLGRYPLGQVIATGEVARIHKSTYLDSKGATHSAAVKIALDAKDNFLIENEQDILNRLFKVLSPKATVSIPRVVDTFVTADGRAGSVLEFVDGYDFHQSKD